MRWRLEDGQGDSPAVTQGHSKADSGTAAHLVEVEDGNLEVRLLAGGDLPLAIKEPGSRQHSREVWPPLQDLIVHRDAATPAGQAPRLSVFEA